MNIQDESGQPYFQKDWLLKNVIHLTQEEIDENKKWKNKV